MSDEAAWIDRARAEVARAEFWRLMEGVSREEMHETFWRIGRDRLRIMDAERGDATDN